MTDVCLRPLLYQSGLFGRPLHHLYSAWEHFIPTHTVLRSERPAMSMTTTVVDVKLPKSPG
jgi:hypothetical protein